MNALLVFASMFNEKDRMNHRMCRSLYSWLDIIAHGCRIAVCFPLIYLGPNTADAFSTVPPQNATLTD